MTWIPAVTVLVCWFIREYTLLCAVKRPVEVHVYVNGVEGEDGGGEELDADVLPPNKPETEEVTRFN